MNQVNRITLTAGGAPGSGKTSLLILLLDMMADAGLLAHHETRSLTQSPRDHFAEARVMNADSEAIEVMVDLEAVLATRLALEDFNNGTIAPADMPADKMTIDTGQEFQGVEGTISIDPFILTVFQTKVALMREFENVIDAVQGAGLPLLPMRLTFERYVIPQA